MYLTFTTLPPEMNHQASREETQLVKHLLCKPRSEIYIQSAGRTAGKAAYACNLST